MASIRLLSSISGLSAMRHQTHFIENCYSYLWERTMLLILWVSYIHIGFSCNDNRALNTLRPIQNGRHFADDIFKCIFLNSIVWISIKIALKFVPKGPINNIPALVQKMAWRRSGDKALFESILVSLPAHICVTRPQWVNDTLIPVLLYTHSLKSQDSWE